MKDVIDAVSKDFTAAGNYAQLISPQPPGSGKPPKAFEAITGILQTAATITGGPLTLQILCGDGVWRQIGASLTAQATAYLFSLESFTNQNRGLILYGARFNLAALLSVGSVIYAELYGY